MEKMLSLKILSLLLLVVFGVECTLMSSAEKPAAFYFIDMAEHYIKSGFKNGKFFNDMQFEGSYM